MAVRGPDEQDRERRLHRAAMTRAMGAPPEDSAADAREQAEKDAEEAARNRAEHHALWVDMQVKAAMERGDFDNLPGAGKPLKLPDRHDPDWWVKGLIEREKVTGVLPPAIALRKEDAQLDAELDRLGSEAEVRRTVTDFNRRVVEARRQLQGGPPVVTPTRDVDAEVEAWHSRRRARLRRDRPAHDEEAPRRTRTRTQRGWRFWRHGGAAR